MISRCLFFFFFLASISHSYSNDLDSLLAESQKEGLKGTARADVLNDLGFEYWYSNPSLGISYVKQGLELSKELDYTYGIAEARAYLSYLYRVIGNYDEALSEGFLALSMAEPNQFVPIQDFVYSNMGMTYEYLGETDKALDFQRQSFNLSRKRDIPIYIAHSANNIGNVFFRLEQWDSTLYYYNLSLKIRQENNDEPTIAESLNNIGEVYRMKGQYENALNYYKRSLAISKKYQSWNEIAMTKMNYGATLLGMGRLDSAEYYLNEAYALSDSLDYKNWKLETLTYLKQMAENRQDYKLALQYHETYTALKDSVFNIQKEREIRAMESNYERLQQEKELEILKKKNEIAAITRNSLIIGILILALVFYLLYSRQRLKAKKNKEIFKTRQELAEARETQLKKELDFHTRALSNYTLSMVQRNELLEEIQKETKELAKSVPGIGMKKTNAIDRLVNQSINLDKDWQQFEIYFNNVHNNFFSDLKKSYPELTNNDMRLCALIKLNFNTKEMATILAISPDSVKMARHRLRKKMNLDAGQDISTVLV